jgi:hypothetical protein
MALLTRYWLLPYVDNATNNDTFIEELMKRNPPFTADHYVRCFGHILNLVAKNALALIEVEISGIRNYLKAIVGFLRLQQLQNESTEQGGIR